jgi:membrane protein
VFAELRSIVVTTYRNWRRARTIRLGAGIAYYALFGIVPLLSLSLLLAQVLVDPARVNDFFLQLADEAGVEASAAQDFVDGIDRSSIRTGLGLVGFGSLVFTALVVFFALQDAFDEVWEVPVVEGLRHSVLRRLTAATVVTGGAAALILMLVVNSVTSVLESLIPGDGELATAVTGLIGGLSSWLVLVLAVAVVFQVLTRVRIHTWALVVGALATAALLAVGTSLVGVFLSTYGGRSLPGAATGVFLALSWLYYVAQMVLVGLHLTRVLHERRDGAPAAPAQAGSV